MKFSRFIFGIMIISMTFLVQASNIRKYNVKKYIDQLPIGSNLALIVQKVGVKTSIIDYRGQQMSLPASTQKIITALAALLQLGPNFRFNTTFESKGYITNGLLKGDLIARFGGDPTFKRQDLHDMVLALKQYGIQKIIGNVVIDTSIFSSHDKAPGWSWNDMIQCFSTPPSAAIIDRNCFPVTIYSAKKPNDIAFIYTDSYYPITILSQVKTLIKGSPNIKYCDLDVISKDFNRYVFSGCLPQRSDPLSLSFSIQDGANYAGLLLKKELKEIGINYKGTLLYQTQTNKPGTILVSKRSAPLRDLLKIMLKKSDNMIADVIFRMTGHVHFGIPGTWKAGSDAIRKNLLQYAGINLGNTIAVDGSGLSRLNLISPITMMNVLQYIARHDDKLHIISMLPLSGHDGSLQFRSGLHEAGLDGKVFAKTGSLQGVYNLAGFIVTENKKKIAFVQYLSGYSIESDNQVNYLNRQKTPLMRFEHQLYRDIYQNN